MRSYWVYILTNEHHGVLYVGVTGNLMQRLHQHRNGTLDGFTKRYSVNRLVYFEQLPDPLSAIKREKQIKGGSRRRKDELVRNFNPMWRDLYEEVMHL